VIVTGWSVKGGSGTTVIATALAGEMFHGSGASRGIMVDLSGDASALLGRSSQPRAGLCDWLLADPSVDAHALGHLLDDGSPMVLREGEGRGLLTEDPFLVERLQDGLRWLDQHYSGVVIDVGSATDWLAEMMCDQADVSLLVLRPCSLSVRAAAQSKRSVAGAVLVGEGSRSLMPRDIEGLLGVPMLAHVRHSPSIAQCVDAGRFGRATPRELRRALRAVVGTVRSIA
jgi:cellulose biosynthesis protein BcsQ